MDRSDSLLQELPWRGPGPGRPELPLPPEPMPLIRHGRPRKQWRYVGVYGPDVMLCAARAEVGLLGQCFWAVWDRRRGRSFDHTRLRPGGREVILDGPRVEINYGNLRARIELSEHSALETVCPSGDSWAWTRKRAGVPARGTVEIGSHRIEFESFAVDDESAGYHRRDTAWMWSAGVGTATDGRPVAWNLVEGINDPIENSERGIWIGDEPITEPAPVTFVGLDAVRFIDGDTLTFDGESERSREDNFLLIRSSYRHRFGTFSGRLQGGIELAEGFGVMEQHEALW